MGNDSPLAVLSRQEQAALQLLQAAVRAGHEPADRPDPRGDRDVAGVVHRPEAEPARHQRRQPADAARGARSRSSTSTTWRGCATIEKHTGGKFKSYELDITYPLAWGERRRRGQARLAVRREPSTRSASGHNILIITDRQRRPRARRDPGAAGAVGDPPAPGARGPAHDRRPGGRDRLGARGASLRACSPATAPRPCTRTSRWRRWPRCTTTCRASCRPRRRSTTTSRRSARACRRSCPRWASSTYMSYCGAQIFEAIGLEKTLVDKYFRGTAIQVGGIGVFEVAEEAMRMHRAAFGDDPVLAEHARRRRRVRLARARRRAHVDARRDRQAAAQRARQQASRPTRNTRRSSTTRASAT